MTTTDPALPNKRHARRRRRAPLRVSAREAPDMRESSVRITRRFRAMSTDVFVAISAERGEIRLTHFAHGQAVPTRPMRLGAPHGNGHA
jgi:hypothetical protein